MTRTLPLPRGSSSPRRARARERAGARERALTGRLGGWGLLLAILSCVARGPVLEAADGAPKELDFNRDVRPILLANCISCHGPDGTERKAGLRLDTRVGATHDLGGRRAVVPGDPLKSELIARVCAEDPGERMPPPKTGKKLGATEIETLKRWIKAGAPYAEHWSYVRPVRRELPATGKPEWCRNPVDVFLLARLEREGLSTSEEADRRALIRRVSLDLTGLPPSPAEVERFLGDRSPAAYEELVDRLLASSAYGEHWAHRWLDLARYADSAGYADDPPREIWGYRDWVIRAFNRNLPYDELTIEQIAGDLLPSPSADQLMATAFHRNTQTNSEGGTDDEEFRNVAIVDRVNTTLAVWMGTTIACAQCHNHKYDPLSQEEYFRLFAFFNNTEDADRNDEAPRLPFYTEEAASAREALLARVGELERRLETPTEELRQAASAWAAAFPRDLGWRAARPLNARLGEGDIPVPAEGLLALPPGPAPGPLVIEVPVVGPLAAVRIEAPASPPAAGGGPPSGALRLGRVSLTLAAAPGTNPVGRFVRVELPGDKKLLHLAEVEVASGGRNVAREGVASQSTTAFNGPAALAIDGNTNGDYSAGSTSHTAESKDPWWEVDLRGQVPVSSITVWNRTDGGLQSRLDGFIVKLLAEDRRVLWQSPAGKGPAASVSLAPGGDHSLQIAAAAGDPPIEGIDASQLTRDGTLGKGWVKQGERDASLTLILAAREEAPPGSRLQLRCEGPGKDPPVLPAVLSVSTSGAGGALEWTRLPQEVLLALGALGPAKNDAAAREVVVRHYVRQIAPALEETRRELADARKRLEGIQPSSVPILRELAGDRRRKTQIQYRGNFLDRGPEVTPGAPAAFPPLPEGSAPDRLGLARWLVDRANPLTARVAVNRLWEKLFGTGIVATSEELGAQGELPSHPELLDWLAVELMENGWDQKSLLRLLVTSSAYRQSSRVTPDLVERDPENRLLARGPRVRLGAETVRDQALFVSGLLSTKLYGPPVRPPQPSSGLSAAFGSAIDWQTSTGEDRYRRGLYVLWRRSNPYPSMSTFDATNREVCTIRRARTNTPLQALVTLNDPVYLEAAQALARRMVREGGPAREGIATRGIELSLCRPPADGELQRLLQLQSEAAQRYTRDPELARRLATEPLGPLPPGMEPGDLAAWTLTANVILNLDEMFQCP